MVLSKGFVIVAVLARCRFSPGNPRSRMELTSPTDLAKEKVQTVQDYVLFCLQAVANLFRKPLYFKFSCSLAEEPIS